jgi:hypothetical protein
MFEEDTDYQVMGIPLEEGMKIIRGPGSKPYLSYEKTLPKGIGLDDLVDGIS